MSEERKYVDVELKCSNCRYEKLATDGHWLNHCSQCGKEGTFEVTKRHDHVLSHAEATALGYGIVSI